MANISSPTMQSFPQGAASANTGPIPPRQVQTANHVFDDRTEFVGPESPGKDRARGAIEQSIGSTKESLGRLINSDKLAEKGAKQREAGYQQEQAALRRDDSSNVAGAVDRGFKGVMDKLTPDRSHKDDTADAHPAFAEQDELF